MPHDKMAQHYVSKDGKLVRTNPFCPRCGRGVFMADHGNFWVCGKCGIRYNKKFFGAHVQGTQPKQLKHDGR